MFRDEILNVRQTDGYQKNPKEQKKNNFSVQWKTGAESVLCPPHLRPVLGKHPLRLHGSRVLRAARQRGNNTRSSERRSVLREQVFLQDAPNPELIAKTHLHIWWCRTDVSGLTADCCSGL